MMTRSAPSRTIASPGLQPSAAAKLVRCDGPPIARNFRTVPNARNATAEREPPRRTQLVILWPEMSKVVLAVASTALTILALEFVLRFAEGEPLRIVDGIVLWSVRSPRSDPADIERAAHDRDAFTIVGLGDSIMYGVSVPKEATYLEHARRILAQRSKRRIEILNLAVPGYNTVQENAVHEELATQLEADLVLVHFWANDAQQYVSDGDYVYDTGLSWDEQRPAAGSFAARLRDLLLAHSRLYDHVDAQVLRLQTHPRSSSDESVDVARMCHALTAIDERAGRRLLVLSSPPVDRPLPAGDNVPESLRQCASPRGIEIVDVTAWLGGAGAEGVGLDNCHFNEEGHRRVGEGLAAYLLAHQLHQ
jgi:lysophospholipase L1-like esterase